MKAYKIERSKTGIPALWEEGGAYTNTGCASLITNRYGDPKKALYIKQHGNLACYQHALIPIQVGDLVVSATWNRRTGVDYMVEQIVNIEMDKATVEEINLDDVELLAGDPLVNALLCAAEKAQTYHCREAVYCL